VTTEVGWAQLEAQLAQMASELPIELRAAHEKLESATRSKALSRPEVETHIAALRADSEILARGGTLNDVIEASNRGERSIDQRDWQPQQVYQAQRQIFLTQAQPAQPAEEPAPVPAPVVIVAMSACQAQELSSGAAFANHPQGLHDDFRALDELLSTEGVDDWEGHYGDDARTWRPFGAEEPTFVELATEVVADLNQRESYQPPLQPLFLDIEELSEDRSMLKTLERGCVVVMDSLSMRHPQVQRWFYKSRLDAYQSTSVLVFAPIHKVFQTSRGLSVMIVLRLDELEFSKRIDEPRDFGVCTEESERRKLVKWLSTRIQGLAPDIGAQQGVLAHMHMAPSRQRP
jgi:hypothetical protein